MGDRVHLNNPRHCVENFGHGCVQCEQSTHSGNRSCEYLRTRALAAQGKAGKGNAERLGRLGQRFRNEHF
jgi:hypothetical protein